MRGIEGTMLSADEAATVIALSVCGGAVHVLDVYEKDSFLVQIKETGQVFRLAVTEKEGSW